MISHGKQSPDVTEAGDLHELAQAPRGGDVRLGDVHTGALGADKQVAEAVSRIEMNNCQDLLLPLPHEAAFSSCYRDTSLGLDSGIALKKKNI